MTWNHTRRLLGVLLLIAAAVRCSSTMAADNRPNIVFLLADDLGYGDLGCYGHPYARTPNLDRLAGEGSRFLQFYVTGVTCCPSRTGFMTSRHPAEYATYPAVGGFGDRVTVTELLKRAGYAAGHFGKWHIGPETQPGTYGIDVIEISGGDRRGARGRDAQVFDAAIRFIEEHRDQPFYVNVWGHITHNPVDPPASYVERFRDLTVSTADFPAPMQEKFATCQARGGNISDCMRRYLADVSALDDSVGRLLTRLDELGLRDNTIVVFSSDHGAPAIPTTERTNVQRRRRNQRQAADPERFALTLNLMGFNGGLRGGKHGMYEGGVRVPLIIRWPGHVPAGRVDETSVISGIDWLPTLCRIAGIEIDAAQFEGEDVSACWLGGVYSRTRPLLWKTSSPGSPAGIRDGKWKLIHPSGRRGADELYNLAIDRAEEHNVAGEHPEVVARLSATVDAWTGTLPTEYVKDGVGDND